MILVDAGPLVALLDGTDATHRSCLGTLKSINESLATTQSVLTEAFHLLGPSSKGTLNLMDFIADGGLDVLTLNPLGKRFKHL